MGRSQGLINGGRTTWTRYRIVEREPELGDTVSQVGTWEPGIVVELAGDGPDHICECEGSMYPVPKGEVQVIEPDRQTDQAARRRRDYAAACGRITERMKG